MKRFFSIILLTLLCFQGVASSTLSENKQWDKLVDYVNCRYVRAYIDGYAQLDTSKSDVKLYMEKIKPSLDCIGEVSFSGGEIRFSGTPLTYDELSKLLQKNQWSGTNKNLSSVINERKQNVNVRDVMKLISIDNFSPSMQNYLREDYDALCKIFSSNAESSEEVAKLKVELKSLSEQLNLTKRNVDKYRSDADFWYFIAIVIIVLFLLSVALIAYLYVKVSKALKSRKEYYKSKCTKLEDDKKCKENEIDRLKIHNKNLKDKLEELQKTINKTKEKVVEYKDQPIVVKEQPVLVPEKPKEEIRYFQYPNANLEIKQLFESESPNFYYKATMEGNSRAKFKFCGKSEKAINNSDSYLANACEYKDIPSNASIVITNEPGIIICHGGVWKVEKKAKISFS